MNALVIVFVIINFRESKNWTTMNFFTKAGFERHPSCPTAINAAVIQYDLNEKLGTELKEFLEKKGCVKIYDRMTMPQVDHIVRLNSQILYYEDAISFADREKSLIKMSNRSEIALYFLSALYAKKNKKKELLETIGKISFDKIPASARFYEKVMAEVVYPYCLKNKLNSCVTQIYGMTIRPDRMWL